MISARMVGRVGFALAILFPTIAYGQTYKARKVEALDGTVACNWARDRLITLISGPCEGFVAPQKVEVGGTFQANGKTKTINVIFANKIEKDMPTLKLRAGEWTCTAAESTSDIPVVSGKNQHTGTWLYISKCRPVE